MFFLGYDASTKTDFTEKMQKILELPDFRAANPNLERGGNLLSQLKDGGSFLLEYPYIDRHYRNTYYSFHSSKFMATGRNCIRVHIFDEKSVDINFDKNTITAKEK